MAKLMARAASNALKVFLISGTSNSRGSGSPVARRSPLAAMVVGPRIIASRRAIIRQRQAGKPEAAGILTHLPDGLVFAMWLTDKYGARIPTIQLASQPIRLPRSRSDFAHPQSQQDRSSRACGGPATKRGHPARSVPPWVRQRHEPRVRRVPRTVEGTVAGD